MHWRLQKHTKKRNSEELLLGLQASLSNCRAPNKLNRFESAASTEELPTHWQKTWDESSVPQVT